MHEHEKDDDEKTWYPFTQAEYDHLAAKGITPFTEYHLRQFMVSLSQNDARWTDMLRSYYPASMGP